MDTKRLNIDKKIVNILILTFVVDFAVFIIVPVLNIYLSKVLHFNLFKVGFFASLNNIANIVGSIIAGIIVKRYGYKRTIVFSLLVQAVSLALLGVFKNFALLCLANGLVGLTYSLSTVSLQALLVIYSDREDSKKVFSIKTVVSNVGITLGVLVGGFINGNRLYHLGFVISLTIVFLSSGFSSFFVKFSEEKRNKSEIPDNRNNKVSLSFSNVKHIIRTNAQLIYFNILLIGFWISYSAFLLNIPIYVYDYFKGFNIGIIYIINTLGVAVFQLPLMRIVSRKLTDLKILFAGISFIAASFLLLFTSFNVVLLILSIVIFTLGEIFVIPTIPTYISIISPKDNISMYMGVMMFFRYVGLTVGNILGGGVGDLLVSLGVSSRNFWLLYTVISALTAILLYTTFILNKKEVKRDCTQ